jgi:hypothetical protein
VVDVAGEVWEEGDPPPKIAPIAVKMAKSATITKHPMAAALVRGTFAPHFGQASAFVLSSPPHSLHFVMAMRFPPRVNCPEDALDQCSG